MLKTKVVIVISILILLCLCIGGPALISAKASSQTMLELIKYSPDELTAERTRLQALVDQEKDPKFTELVKKWENDSGRFQPFSLLDSITPSEKERYEMVGQYDEMLQADADAQVADKLYYDLTSYNQAKTQVTVLCQVVKLWDPTQQLNPYETIWESPNNVSLGLDYCNASETVTKDITQKVALLKVAWETKTVVESNV